MEDIVLYVFKREVALLDSGKVFDPIRDGELFDGDLFGHEMPPRGKYNAKCDNGRGERETRRRDGTVGKIPGRTASAVRGNGRAFLSRRPTLSRAVCGADF